MGQRWRRADGLALLVLVALVAVLVETHDPGWRTSVDNQPVALLRANVAFRAVAVPAGRHIIEMVYRPPLTEAGLVLGGLTLVLTLVLLVRRPRPAA